MTQAQSGRPPRVFISVGEPSGDLHGANLIRSLQRVDSRIAVRGLGGPLMRKAGQVQVDDISSIAAMGIAQVIGKIPRFRQALQRVKDDLDEQRPDAVALIDCPGFNWWVARAAKKRGIPVFYYGVPQLWAWGRWRLRKMQRLVDHVLCKLPFEAEWYQEQGINAQYIGHPYFDELLHQQLDGTIVKRLRDRDSHLVALLPGSRRQEVRANLPLQLAAAQRINESQPDTRFIIASFSDEQAVMAREVARSVDIPVEIVVQRTGESIAAADVCIACSGSVSLELLFHRRPTVVVYRVSRSGWMLARWILMKVRYITLVNLLACQDRFETAKGPYRDAPSDVEQVPFPEYACYWDCSREVADHILEWIQDRDEWHRRVSMLEPIRKQLVQRGASDRAARYIVSHIAPGGVAARAA